MRLIGDKLTGTRLSQTGSGATSRKEQLAPAPNAGLPSHPQADLPSTRPDRDPEIRSAISGPVSAMSAIHLMPEADRRAAFQFWVESLRPYPVAWISDAFAYFARNAGGQYPNPQRIIEIINKRRGGA